MSYKPVFSKTDIQTSILKQIRIAFESTANVAATLHGQRQDPPRSIWSSNLSLP